MQDWYQIPEEEVLARLKTCSLGLEEGEAKKRLKEYGKNALKETGKKAWWQIFFGQFQDLLVQILIGAAIISMMSGNGESTIVIFAVLLLNAVLGTIQHEKAQKSLESLKALSAPAAQVIRGGTRQKTAAWEIVPGDILVLEAGDLVAADGRILESVGLQINESSLTGESESVEKERAVMNRELPLAERTNMIFSGGLVTGGRGVIVVTATGMDTEIGRIAQLMNETGEKKTPLQVSLDRFSSRLAIGILGISVVVFLLGLYRGSRILDSMMFAVALAVAAIPEALGTIVTIVQAMGTQRMAKQNAIIKDLKAVESLGCVSVICSDKTGTLTQNKMSAQAVYEKGKVRKLNPSRVIGSRENSSGPHTDEQGERAISARLSESTKGKGPVSLMTAAILANNAEFTGGPGGPPECIGDPTETALLFMAAEEGMNISKIRSSWARLEEIPFDSNRKRMSVVCKKKGGEVFRIVKGAADVLLPRCAYMEKSDGIGPMTGVDRNRIRTQNETWGKEGLRVLAFAYRREKEKAPQDIRAASGGKDMEANLTFIGLAALMDPPRPESRQAVEKAREAGMKPVMITGDHPVTARSIAEKTKILLPGETVISGPELDRFTDTELDEKLPDISVCARVSPEHKIRIVEAWQRKGKIVAMTGDGVNDAPALKKADIGVAMGLGGTEVSRDAASMILADDNFATIISAVENGRNVYRNIQNAIDFLLSGNMAGIFCVLYTSLLALPLPFAPVHLLFINLVTDSLPALAIGMEPAEEGLLKQKPRDPSKGILTKSFLKDIFVQGGLIALCTMAAYYVGLTGSLTDSLTGLGEAAGYGIRTLSQIPEALVGGLKILGMDGAEAISALAGGNIGKAVNVLACGGQRGVASGISIGEFSAAHMPAAAVAAPPSGNSATAATMAFTTLTLARLFHGFNCRSHHSIFHLGLFSNLYSIMAFEAGVVLLAAVLFVPVLQHLFAASDLSLGQIGAVAVFALIPTFFIQAWKLTRECLHR